MLIKPEPSLKDLQLQLESTGLKRKSEDLLKIYNGMTLIRYFEESIRKIYHGEKPIQHGLRGHKRRDAPVSWQGSYYCWYSLSVQRQ